jgi:hypothetical protein
MTSENLNPASDAPSSETQAGPSVAYVNEVVLSGLSEFGIRLTEDVRVTNEQGLSASEFVALLKQHGWSWPRQWYRKNLNYFQHDFGAKHFEKEVEPGRWIHIVVSPGLRSGQGSRSVKDWTLPPRHIELHAEKGWLRPSSFRHLWSFLKNWLWSRIRD